ncbi:sugar phosphate nucleotidyltransferase [Paenibacillus hexagrammi]|uniref:NTP transferase domain-containing protein n=1 Tax=Paenibacillus hexagrammi TaxID=2908839 RepID=A0ABY3SP97_9BACL|nr:sugar phosphate nucleotidyltransferase [Paenibacillus sp. YPD9-1]UJF35789.1 NTP transferase domain-containing protein [Paenibacillus sp. YPD9-1]
MEAVIMTGGKGMRMAPYTKVLPKGLLPVGEQPILSIIVKQLRHYGFTSITMACGYLSDLIQTYFGDGSAWGVSIRYHVEKQPLGTVGPLASLQRPSGPFLVMNCDVLTTLDFRQFMQFHTSGGSLLTIASQQKGVPIELGVLETENEYVTNFIEKPMRSAHVSMGIYMMNPDVVDFIPTEQFFDIPDLIHALLAADSSVRHFENDAFWLDIGRISDYTAANDQFEQWKTALLPGEAT